MQSPDQIGIAVAVVGAWLYLVGRISHGHTGTNYRLYTAPPWLRVVCGQPITRDGLSWFPTLIQIGGLGFLVTQVLYLAQWFSATVAVSGTMAIFLGMAMLNWAKITMSVHHPLAPGEWFKELQEKAEGVEVICDNGILRVEFSLSAARSFGFAVSLLSIYAFSQRAIKPYRFGELIGCTALLALGLFFVTYRTEIWKCDGDLITHLGPHGAKTSIRWSDVTSVELIEEDLRLTTPMGNMQVESSGRGFVGFLMLMKTKVQPHKYSDYLRAMIAAVPNLPSNYSAPVS